MGHYQQGLPYFGKNPTIFVHSLSDISDTISNNMRTLADIARDEQNHRPSDPSDISDVPNIHS